MSLIAPESPESRRTPMEVANVTAGVVTKRLPRGLFLVTTENGRQITASLSSTARRLTVHLIPGEPVSVRLSKFDPSRGQIV